MVIFLSSHSLHIRSLVIVVPGEVKPAVVIALLAALLAASTAALVTRCVEQSLWLKLAPGFSNRKLTVGESHRLAQWSVSPLARLSYLLRGHSWMLRISGIFLVSTAVVSPILISGISQRDTTLITETSQSQNQTAFSGFLDTANILYNGGNFKDVPMMIAAVASMSNLSAPAAPICSEQSCSVTAQVASIRADCNFTETENPNDVGGTSDTSVTSFTFCSTLNPKICRALVSANPATYANFTTGPSGDIGCDPFSLSEICPPGSWGTIFGVWVNDGATSPGPGPIKTVDCALTYGNVTVQQVGNGTPNLDRNSFVKSVYTWTDYQAGQWERIYTEATGDNGDSGATQAPYCFSGGVVPTGANTLFSDPVGWPLLGDNAGDLADMVARRIERNFDVGTLFAFARAPHASNLEFSETSTTPVWVYDSKVLLVLIVPIVASLLGVWGRWRVTNKEVNVGYNPVEIARRGPVLMMAGDKTGKSAAVLDRKEWSKLRLWGVEASRMDGHQCGGGRPQLAVGEEQ